MSSLKDRIEWLESELPPNPPRFRFHADLPFAILPYDPDEEWELRREVRNLATRLENRGRTVVTVSLAELFWRAIEESEGIEPLIRLERERGFAVAQNQVHTYLSDRDFAHLPDLVTARLAPLDPERHIAFLLRVACLAPAAYHASKLLEEMQGRVRVPTVLFYPGCLEGTNSLRFMCLPDRDPLPAYRVKIYGLR